ncbi:MAG: hypothetical protein FJZ05_01565 [Candidatus Nealsonbacteria bacterium]|nr:hypothetical protein [Candidatus Nealsonbacteria bacterium]
MGILLGFFTGSSAGFFTGKFLAGDKTGDIGLFVLAFNLGDWYIHLHHWLISFFLLLFLVFFLRKKYKLSPLLFTFAAGFLVGWMFQGIYCYEDWQQIIIKQNI